MTNLDILLEQYLGSFQNQYLETFFGFLTKFGSTYAAIIIALVIVFFLWRKNKVLTKYFALFFLGNELAVYLIKNVFERLRPFGALKYGEFDGSLPSGHAAASMFLYGFACYLLVRLYPKGVRRNAIISSLVLLVVLIGFSRLYLDIHYLSDMLAGYVLGGLFLFGLIRSAKNLF